MSGPPAPPPVDRLVREALAEDVGDGDVTGQWTVPEEVAGTAEIRTRRAGVVCGVHAAAAAFLAAPAAGGRRPAVERLAADGEAVEPGHALLRVRGPLRPILAAERTALNFLARLSGIATLTRRYVQAVEGTGCRIADTRKTTPGWRALEKYATAVGGAENHRAGLYDMVLIKENHIRAVGGVREALRAVREPARARGLPVEVEVTSLQELSAALAEGPDRILLDNLPPDVLGAAVRQVRDRPPPRPLLEASGGVTLDTVGEIAATGVDLVSVGALTHSPPALDLTLLVTEVKR